MIIDTFDTLYADPHSRIGDLRRAEVKWIDHAAKENPPIPERMFILGCIGYYQKNKKIFPWNGRKISKFNKSAKVFLSPAFL